MGRILDLPVAEVFEPLLGDARYKGAWGGRGSAKSHFFADRLIERCLLKPTRAVCVREFQSSLEQSCKRLLEDKIILHKLSSEFRVMNTHIETPGDGVVIFQGMKQQTDESIKSLEGFDIAWVEEAQSLSERSLTILRPTIRVPDSELWFSWNPRHKTDPVDKLLRGPDKPPNAIVVRSSWRDNPWFPAVLREEMLWDRARDSEKYDHIWDGQYEKHSESRVFKNWRVEAFDPPSNDTTFYFGGDWGFSVDPSVLIRCWLRDSKTLMIDGEAFQIGTEIDYTPTLFDGVVCGCIPERDGTVLRPCAMPAMHGMARAWPIIADSARPETISYLRRHGYPRIEPAVKGANSVKEGVIFLQGYNIIIHPRCVHTEDEFRHYHYKTDPQTNMVTPILEDKKNHVIDSVRYAVERLRAATFNYEEAGMTSAATW